MKWRVYYSDREVSDGEMPIEELPGLDVQAIVFTDPQVGWAMTHTFDYYVWMLDIWKGVDIFGLWDYLARPGWKKVLFGRTITSEQYDAIYQKAKAERAFANKNGWLPGERHP